MVTGSTHPRLISEWLAEFDLASLVGELDRTGFTVDKRKFETLDSKIAERIVEISPADSKRKIRLDTKTNVQCLRAGNLRFNNNETQEHTMNLSDLLIVAFLERQSQDFQSGMGRNITCFRFFF